MHQARHGMRVGKLKMENRIKRIKVFDTDENFRISEFMHFCSKMLKRTERSRKAPAMIVFCAFQQLQMVIDYGKKYGFNNHIPLVFIKKSSPQVLKANMKVVGATEYALVLYRKTSEIQ